MLCLILGVTSCILILFLTLLGVIILFNFLIRPSLWTAFNLVMLIYFFFSIILGSHKIFMLTSIICQYVEPFSGERNLASLFVDQLDRFEKLEDACTIYVYWSGTALVREGILTGMIFVR